MKSSSEVNPNFGVPLGFRCVFQPNDQELIVYLSCKANGEPLPYDGVIKEIELYSVEDPSTLFDGGGDIAYVFTRVKKSSGKGSGKGLKTNRKVNNGNSTWRTCDNEGLICNREGNCIGSKRNLNLVAERNGKSRATGFHMTEFSLSESSLKSAKFKDYVLCIITKKPIRQSGSSHGVENTSSNSSENVFRTPITNLYNFFTSSTTSVDSEKFPVTLTTHAHFIP